METVAGSTGSPSSGTCDAIGLSESAAEFVAGGVHAVDASEEGC